MNQNNCADLTSLKVRKCLFSAFSAILTINIFAMALSINYDSRNLNKLILMNSELLYPKCKPRSVSLPFQKGNENVKCYRHCSNNTLPMMTKLEANEKPVFFIESSCRSFEEKQIRLQPRQACVVESAAKLNPKRTIYVLFVSSSDVERNSANEIKDPVLKAVLDYPNVKFRHLHFESYVNNTPIASLFEKGNLEKSTHPIVHSSDVLRILTLWKYGGIYLDLDIISKKSLDELNNNFVVYELSNRTVVHNCVFGFEKEGVGHKFLESCLEDLRDHFKGTVWTENGSGLITRNMVKTCHVSRADKLVTTNTCNFTFYDKKTFFAIHPFDFPSKQYSYTLFFNENLTQIASKIVDGSIGIHFWNSATIDFKVHKNSSCLFTQIAKQYCPNIYKAVKDYI